METTIRDLQHIIETYALRIDEINDYVFSEKTDVSKWSKKEILGHLIDSAHNNLRRFICGQYDITPNIVYDQDFWVIANNYQQVPKREIIRFWELINNQILQILRDMPPANYHKECNTGKKKPELHSLQWLAADYVKHMKHHINQILPGSFAISYP